MRTAICVALLCLTTTASLAATPAGQPVDLLAALNTGQVSAEFRGAGGAAVTGVIERTEDGPTSLEISPGTQFWAQAGGGSIQGQTTRGRVSVNLEKERVAFVEVPTCCTNIGLPSPTPDDIMVPTPSPDPRLTALLSLPDIQTRPLEAVQVAVWAVANNARYYEVRTIISQTDAAGEAPAGRGPYAEGMIGLAAELVRLAGLEPTQFRLFR